MGTGGLIRVSLIVCALLALAALLPGRALARESAFDATVNQILSLPYQTAYAPVGLDSAFTGETPPVANIAPAQDYTSGSIPGRPDSPAWPANFKQVTLTSGDGAKLLGELAMLPDRKSVV